MEKTLPREAYVDMDWFERERDRVFESQWFAMGRAEEIPEPGDHLVCDVAGESVIVTRQRDGGLAAADDRQPGFLVPLDRDQDGLVVDPGRIVSLVQPPHLAAGNEGHPDRPVTGVRQPGSVG
jgi:hypothetical protein